MSDLIAWAVLIGLFALVIWGIVAVAGGAGRRKGGGFQMMAAMMLGLGAPLDPPQRHLIEAKDETPKGSPETGEPELDD